MDVQRVARAFRAGREVLLTASALLGVLCLMLTLVAPVAGLRPLVFLSGSMSPTVPAGSLGVSRTTDAADLRVGDVVTVEVPGSFVTHRVVEVEHADGVAVLRLRGDANREVDAQVYRVAEAPRLLFSVPTLGSLVAWLSRAPGVHVLALYVVVVLGSLRRRGGDGAGGCGGGPASRSDDDVPARPERGSRRARIAATAALAVAVSWGITPQAHAAWTDSVPVTGGTVSTVAVTATSATCGPLGVGLPTISWTAVPGATGYRLRYGAWGAETLEVGSGTTSTVLTGLVVGGTFTVEVLYGSWVSAPSAPLTYTVALGPLLTACL